MLAVTNPMFLGEEMAGGHLVLLGCIYGMLIVSTAC
jgi:hypothetical protein